jgi:iron(III) transport system substrate-binding protein
MATGLRRRLVAVTITLALATAAACGGGDNNSDEADRTTDAGPAGDAAWDEVVTAAQAEGGVTIYSSQGLVQLEDLAERFEAEYGIPVTVVRDVDNTLATKLDAEDTTGSYVADVVAVADPIWIETKGADGWFAQPTGPAFDEPDYDRATNVAADGSFISSAAVLTFGWNTSLYPDGLDDYDDLLDPALAGGKIGVMEPSSPVVVDFYANYLAGKFGPDFLEDLAAQEPRLYPSSLPMAQALASGEIAAGAFVGDMVDEREAGAPVDSGLSDTVWGARFHTVVLNDAPHPNAAQLLANYMITPAGQEAIARKSAAVLPGVEGTTTTIDKVEIIDTSTLTPDVVADFEATWQNLFH